MNTESTATVALKGSFHERFCGKFCGCVYSESRHCGSVEELEEPKDYGFVSKNEKNFKKIRLNLDEILNTILSV